MSTSSESSSSEARELRLVGAVELKIALAESDTSLEAILKVYLAPLLLKLASDHLSVRNKVISVCQHINTRITLPSIKLPVAALLKQFKENPAVPLIRHFDLHYIQQGLERLQPADRIEIFPALLNGISSDVESSPTHGAALFNLVLRLLPFFTLPPRGSKDDDALRAHLGFSERPEDATFLALWFGKLFLLSISRSSLQNTSETDRPRCPGLSATEYDFLTLQRKADTWDDASPHGLNLTQSKILALKFLGSGAFTDKERFLPALFASADTNSNIYEFGEDLTKRAIPKISLEDRVLVEQLFEIYFGRSTPELVPSVRPALQTKILSLLAKSIIATTFTARITALVEQGLVPQSNVGEQESAISSGREGSKLQTGIFSFVTWIARMGNAQDLRSISAPIISKLREFITVQGWPRANFEGIRSQNELSLRGYAYEIIGLLAKSSPDTTLLEADLDLVKWLFQSLSEEASGGNIAVSVEEALSSIIGALSKSLNDEVANLLRGLLLHHMTLDVGDPSDSQIRRSTRFVAVRFANRCLPYNDPVARWIDLLAIGGHKNERNEVVEEGKKGLDVYWYRMSQSTDQVQIPVPGREPDSKSSFPQFFKLIHLFFVENVERIWKSNNERTTLLSSALSYCRRTLQVEAFQSRSIPVIIDEDWERRLDSLIATDEVAREKFKDAIASMDFGESISAGKNSLTIEGRLSLDEALRIYIQSAFRGFVDGEAFIAIQCGEYLLEICSLSPNKVVQSLVGGVKKLEDPLKANNSAIRSMAAHAFGLITSHDECSIADVSIMSAKLLERAQTWNESVGAETNKVHGSIVALAYLFSRLFFRGRDQLAIDCGLQTYLEMIAQISDGARDSLLQEASDVAISQLCLFSVMKTEQIGTSHSQRSIVAKLSERAMSGDEKAILALGYLGMATPEESADGALLPYIMEQLHKLHDLRQPEIQFTVGEAWSCISIGWDSKALVAKLDIEGSKPRLAEREKTLETVVEMVLADCKKSKPSLRKASLIWLLCLIQYCGHQQAILSNLENCQAAFKGFLADRDELIQESAARGLGLIYEKGDRTAKDDLVRDLLTSFTGGGSKLAGNVTGETQLFEPGDLPTGDGSVTTYKDIMSLASEVGDPSLVYRFMSLASHNAIWSSRAAFGRFGLSNILSESSTDGYLAKNPKLYQKLYRYRFDPNPNVQKAMNDIWLSLVKDPAATISARFDDIIQDLLRTIIAKEWRVRQASCAAIADLIQSQPFGKYETYLKQIWGFCFKVLDDIKETVRVAAMALARVLTSITVRSLEAGESGSTKAGAILAEVIPFLLSQLEASAQEVQLFALDTLLQIVKKSSSRVLKPFIPGLLERLLGLLSILEPQAINYLHLNASKYNLTEQKIDDMRLASIRGSPMMEAIERCLDLLDEESMNIFVPRLEAAMKAAVGLPSRVGCSRVLVSLSTRRSYLFRPYADRLLQLVQKIIFDRNDTVSTSYAAASGYLARIATDKQILKLEEFAQNLYFSSDTDCLSDQRYRIIAGDTILAVSKTATDRVASLAASFLPFIFVAKHNPASEVKASFENAWEQLAGGRRAVALYLKEIIQLATTHLDSTQHALKHASAFAVATSVSNLGETISLSDCGTIWPALEKALGGKSWKGKEAVLEAFVKFVRKSRAFWKGNGQIADQMQMVRSLFIRFAVRCN
ncbi:major component of the proteasome [Xylona heveae TC161]|uniref:Major component of the proteasome n=1 Tax=Xylona heveae (strain CBS 132557 / TC161) TaxID=1328760 RepID=A0A165K1K0_XYLHT|nr:major component of the proteasome [Xylona heveae TC161]KZF26885.1 major component of the proteasome [Xylona heveae TC161]